MKWPRLRVLFTFLFVPQFARETKPPNRTHAKAAARVLSCGLLLKISRERIRAIALVIIIKILIAKLCCYF